MRELGYIAKEMNSIPSPLFSLFLILLNLCEGRSLNLLCIGWFSNPGPISTIDFVTSDIVVQVAVNDFNNRNGRVLPLFATETQNCSVKINLKMVDDEGLVNVAMKQFVNQYPLVDVIQGAISSSVSSPFFPFVAANMFPGF